MNKSFISDAVEIRNSKIQGKGMFAKKRIGKDEIIYRWGGTFIKKDEINKLNREEYIIIQVGEDLWSVEKRDTPEDETYFINHSCEPNVGMKDNVTFVAMRDIDKGEELTTDYAMFESEDYVAKWDCHCGTTLCRKKITGKDYTIAEVRKRYGKYFSPLNKKKLS